MCMAAVPNTFNTFLQHNYFTLCNTNMYIKIIVSDQSRSSVQPEPSKMVDVGQPRNMLGQAYMSDDLGYRKCNYFIIKFDILKLQIELKALDF